MANAFSVIFKSHFAPLSYATTATSSLVPAAETTLRTIVSTTTQASTNSPEPTQSQLSVPSSTTGVTPPSPSSSVSRCDLKEIFNHTCSTEDWWSGFVVLSCMATFFILLLMAILIRIRETCCDSYEMEDQVDHEHTRETSSTLDEYWHGVRNSMELYEEEFDGKISVRKDPRSNRSPSV